MLPTYALDYYQTVHLETIQRMATPTATLRLWAHRGCEHCRQIVEALDALCRLARPAFIHNLPEPNSRR